MKSERVSFCIGAEMTKYLIHGLVLVLLVFLKTPLKADSIPEIVAKAKPAIVEIVSTDAKGTPKTQGTGFFVSPDGLVITNRHVIEGAGTITAVTNNGAMFLFERIFAEPPGADLAVLKFHATDVPFLKLGESTMAVEGQKVIVIGNPTGLMGTVSDGIISAFRENRSLIQITAPVSHGSSGSPVMDETGQVIGIATLGIAEGQNLNFAIPVEQASAALAQPPLSWPTLPRATPTPASDAKVYFDSAEACYERREYDKAISDYTEAIRLDPNYASAFDSRGNAYYARGDYDKAISDFTEAIRLDPNYFRAHVDRGDAYLKQSDFDKAISDYNEAIRLSPNSAWGYAYRATAYEKQGALDKAISDHTEAIRLDPNDGFRYYDRGRAYGKKGDLDKAISDYTEAIRVDPTSSFREDFYFSRGDAYYDLGDYDKAISDLTEAIRLDQTSSGRAAAYQSRGDAYEKHGDHDKAFSDYNEAIRLDPNNASAYASRGKAYYDRGDYDKAISDLAEAIRLDPRSTSNVFAYDTRGKAYCARGDFDKAISDYNEAIRILPLYAFYEARGNAYLHTGNRDKADADFAIAKGQKAGQ
jgi:tetratricopeptide (TPR) repeat protein